MDRTHLTSLTKRRVQNAVNRLTDNNDVSDAELRGNFGDRFLIFQDGKICQIQQRSDSSIYVQSSNLDGCNSDRWPVWQFSGPGLLV